MEMPPAFQAMKPTVMLTRFDDEDDDVLDSWLASLSADELARFLDRLADLPAHVPAVLAPPA